MARAHLRAGHDVLAPQLAVGQDYFDAIDAIVADTGAACHEGVLTGDPERLATQFPGAVRSGRSTARTT